MHIHSLLEKGLAPFKFHEQMVVLDSQLRELLAIHLFEHLRCLLCVFQQLVVSLFDAPRSCFARVLH